MYAQTVQVEVQPHWCGGLTHPLVKVHVVVVVLYGAMITRRLLLAHSNKASRLVAILSRIGRSVYNSTGEEKKRTHASRMASL